MKILVLACVLILSSFQEPDVDSISESVVKVIAQQRAPDFFSPWTKEGPQEATGSGVVIEGRRILTNAHVVRWGSRIEVQAGRSPKKYPVRVVGLDPRVDLAILELEEDQEEFFGDRPWLEIGRELPGLRRSVNVYGYPVGGSDLSVTEGIISRIEYTSYDLERSGLLIQIDAALNPGNSGGPAIVDGMLAGIAIGAMNVGNDIGLLIPGREILAFLEDLADGVYQGPNQIFDVSQTFENDGLRGLLGVGDDVTGLVVTRPASDQADYPLQSLDIITHIGEHDIGNDGKVFVREDLSLAFQVLVPELSSDGVVPLRIVRAGETLQVRVPVATRRDLVILSLDDRYPAYFIYGPMTFTPVQREWAGQLVSGMGHDLLLVESPIAERFNDVARFPGEELVSVMPTLFDHKLTRGYGAPTFWIVDEVNGVAVKNLAHLVEQLARLTDEFVQLTFRGKAQETLVFRRSALEQATEEILEQNGIRRQASEELARVWKAARAGDR